MGTSSEGWSGLALEGFLAEAETLCGLVGVTVEDWVVLHRNKFDLKLNNEPHIAQMLYMERASGRYLHKIYGKTIKDGQLGTPSALKGLAQEIFEHSRVCQGYDCDVKFEPDIIRTPAFHPFPGKMGPNCQMIFKDPRGRAKMCPNCTQDMPGDIEPMSIDVSDFVEAKLGEIDGLKKEKSRDASPYADNQEPTLWPDEIKDTFSDTDYNEDGLNEETDQQDSSSEEIVLIKSRRKEGQIADPNSGSLSKGHGETVELSGESKAKAKEITCDHCSRIFYREQSYRKHRALLRRHERIIPCKLCKKAHYSFDSLAKHMEEKHKQLPETLGKLVQTSDEIKGMKKGQKCSICDMSVNGSVMVHRHRALYHELGDFQCTDCNQYQLTYYHLVMHNYNKHDSALRILEPSANDLEQVEHEDGSTELVRKRHVCPKCKKGFKYDGDWGSHMRYHHSWSVFNCQSCDEMCHYATDFVAHVRNFHSDNPEIKCPKCLEILSLKEDPNCFEAHFTECAKKAIVGDVKDGNEKQLKKTKGTPFQCEKCGKNYFSKYLLRCHLDSHEGVERFQCEKCEYKTNVKSVMQDHQNFHLRAEGKTHDETGLNLFFYCDQCPKKVSTKTSLNLHIKHVHEGVKRSLKCQNCDKTFNSKSRLYTHKRKAHGFVTNWVRRGKRDIAL